MGKNKAQKTKEISRTGDESKQQKTPPRKRGRPSKIVQKTEIQEDIEKRQQDVLNQPVTAVAVPEDKDSSINKTKASEEEEEEEEAKIVVQGLQQEGSIISSACTRVTKEEGVSQEDMQPSSRSRARRKSKPRRSC